MAEGGRRTRQEFHPGSPGPDPSTPCGRATPETASRPFFRGGRPAGQAACGRLVPLWTPDDVRLGGGKLLQITKKENESREAEREKLSF
jgi:hypothetical protein